MAELHEQFIRAPEKGEQASNRKFGLVVGAIFFAIALLHFYFHDYSFSAFNLALGGVGAAMMIAGLVWPRGLTPLNYAWSKLGLLLHKVTNPLFLGVMYLLAVVPTGLIMRLFGADPMARRIGGRESYWIKKTSTRSTPETLKRPY
jgi:hypothetical protein